MQSWTTFVFCEHNVLLSFWGEVRAKVGICAVHAIKVHFYGVGIELQ